MPRTADDPAARAALAGLGWGLLAAAIWAVYSVLARLGVTAGLSPADMSLLRFAPGALLTLPLMWRWGWRDLAGIGWGRGLILTLLAGPGFALLFMTGFTLAPLAHGAVIAPAGQMLAGLGLSAWLGQQRLSRESLVGAGFVLLGLFFMGGDSLLHGESRATLLGDLLFAVAGFCWGTFGTLSRRWQVDPLRVTVVVLVLSFLLFTPPYLALADLSRLAQAGAGMLTLQVLAQGVGRRAGGHAGLQPGGRAAGRRPRRLLRCDGAWRRIAAGDPHPRRGAVHAAGAGHRVGGGGAAHRLRRAAPAAGTTEPTARGVTGCARRAWCDKLRASRAARPGSAAYAALP